MPMQIEKFEVKDEARGSATLLARFSVNLGPITLNGFELVEAGGKRFISEPHRRYQTNGNWKRYSYVWFNNGKGTQVKNEILDLASKEYDRRAAEQPRSTPDDDPFPYDDDDGLPF